MHQKPNSDIEFRIDFEWHTPTQPMEVLDFVVLPVVHAKQ